MEGIKVQVMKMNVPHVRHSDFAKLRALCCRAIVTRLRDSKGSIMKNAFIY